MKKMYFLIVCSIIAIAFIFISFSSDINTVNEKFLLKFGIEINPSPVSFEEIEIPEIFDSVYTNYNFLQIQAGFDLSDFKGMHGVRYTYEMLNFPQNNGKTVYADVICINSNPIGGDICCTAIDGFILPLNYLTAN